MVLAENERARIGGNGGPVDPDFAFAGDPDFITARIIREAAEYLQFKFGELDHIFTKRKGKRPMSFRFVLAYSLRGLVPSESAARILDINRKTYGENAQRPEVWANHDSEEGRAFDQWLEHVSQAIYHHISAKVSEGEALLAHFVDMDVELRRLDKQRKEHEKAEAEALKAAAELEERKRLRAAKGLAKALKGAPNAKAIVAEHLGPRRVAETMSPAGLAVIEKLALARVKDPNARKLTSELNASGLKETLDLGLTFIAEPTGANAPDPRIAINASGLRVFEEAVGLELISRPKAKRGRV